MPSGLSSPVVRFLRQLSQAEQVGDSDAQLLTRFLDHRDQDAFATLVRRHGSLVMGVCRRILGQQQDAEDVFQATFLVLARKARSIRNHASVASWLYGVAYRLATKARLQAQCRHFHEQQVLPMPAADPIQEIAWSELRPVLDEVINGLAERYRRPFILRYLEGRTNEEVARQLCCPVGTVGSRLARARQQLRDRLARRGLALSAGALTTMLTAEGASGAIEAWLNHSTIQAALAFAASKATATVGSAAAFILAKGVLRTMFLTKFTAGALVTIAVTLLGAGTGLLVYKHEAMAHSLPDPRSGQPGAASRYFPAAQREGVLLFIGTEIKEGEQVAPDRLIKVASRDDSPRTFRQLRIGDRVEPGQLLAVLDDRLAYAELKARRASVDAAILDQKASERIRDEAYQTYLTTKRLLEKLRPNEQNEEQRRAKATYDRYVFEVRTKEEAIRKAEAEVQATEIVLQMHEVRSNVRGKIKNILKRPGEAVRAMEPIVEIEVLD